MLFLDTTVLVGAADSRDECHEDGKAILQAVASGKPGIALTSEYVLDETLTILSGKRGVGTPQAIKFVRGVMQSPRVRVLSVDGEDFANALAEFPKTGALGLSFTDTVSLVLMAAQGCKTLCSHDAGFDQVKGIDRRPDL